MKLQKLLDNPLLSKAKVLAGKKYAGREFTCISKGALVSSAPDFLLVYTEKDFNETWCDYFCRMKSRNAAGILFIGRNKSEFDISESDCMWCEENGFPLIWIPYDNSTLFLARISSSLNEEYSRSQLAENWLYDLCHKDIVIADESLIASYGYNMNYCYYCLLLRLDESELPEHLTMDQLLISASNQLSWQLSYQQAEVLNFMERDTLVLFLPFPMDKKLPNAVRKINSAVEKLQKQTGYRWKAYIGERANSIQLFRNSFNTACQTRREVEKSGTYRQVSYYEEWQMFILLCHAPDSELRDYVRKKLGPILDQLDLMDTLHVYLGNRENLKRTAVELYIHQNTLKYRLNKISELLQCNLQDSSTLFYLQIALAFYSHLNGTNGIMLKRAQDYFDANPVEKLFQESTGDR